MSDAKDERKSGHRVPIVAVDVGGSGLRLTTWTDAAQPGPVRSASGARVGASGVDLDALIADAKKLLGEDRPEILVWSMRGLLFLSDTANVAGTLANQLKAKTTVVVSDALANLVGAIGDLVPGAVVAAGTGAVAFGTDFRSIWQRVDGWGHVLGDAGSAASVGMNGLRAALRANDNLPGGSQRLLETATDRIGPPSTWPRQMMTSADAPERLAAIAPLVTEAAEQGDDAAAAICMDAGQSLGQALLTAAEGIAGAKLVATGGLLKAASIRTALEAQVIAHGGTLTDAAGGALDGALSLGRQFAATGKLPTHAPFLTIEQRR